LTTTLLFAEMCMGLLPPGVLNVIVDQNDLGGYLTQHLDVAKVAFTASTATGKKVIASVAGTIKRVTLELGGNDAAIVLDDVNVKEVAARIFQGAMVNTGQVCLAIKRVYVPDSLYEAMGAELAELAKATVNRGKATRLPGPRDNRARILNSGDVRIDGRVDSEPAAPPNSPGRMLARPPQRSYRAPGPARQSCSR
jgi:acyl-CoA reductase-like NAD-dependent aldehyde dehydrogenase